MAGGTTSPHDNGRDTCGFRQWDAGSQLYSAGAADVRPARPGRHGDLPSRTDYSYRREFAPGAQLAGRYERDGGFLALPWPAAYGPHSEPSPTFSWRRGEPCGGFRPD